MTLKKKNKGKGKGKGKPGKKSISLSDQINIEAQNRLSEFLREQRIQEEIPSTSSARRLRNEEISQAQDARSEYSNFTEDLSIGGETKTIYIRRVDCLLNSVPIDQIEDKQTGKIILH